MTDKVFIDTNILVYAFLDADNSESHTKHAKAVKLLQSLTGTSQIILSTQVLSEYYSALLKHKITDNDIQDSIQALIRAVDVATHDNKEACVGGFGAQRQSAKQHRKHTHHKGFGAKKQSPSTSPPPHESWRIAYRRIRHTDVKECEDK